MVGVRADGSCQLVKELVVFGPIFSGKHIGINPTVRLKKGVVKMGGRNS